MALIHNVTGRRVLALGGGWQLTSTASGAAVTPADIDAGSRWVSAVVPGTVAESLSRAGTWSLQEPAPLHDRDHWYRREIRGDGPTTLRFEGLATIAEVWLDDQLILSSRNMFQCHEVDVTLAGVHVLHICFRALATALAAMTGAGRWRPRMIAPSTLRNVRTTALGHMPGWCPRVDIVGPWRGITAITHGEARVVTADVRARLIGSTGHLDVTIVLDKTARGDVDRDGHVACAGAQGPLVRVGDATWTAHLEIRDVAAWWPHTHGTPVLHSVVASLGGSEIDLGTCGFRSVMVDRGDDGKGFQIVVNDVPIFARGAVWASVSLLKLPTERDAIAAWLERAREAGFNMIRVPGTTVYEAQAFYDLCSELGLLVWQDFMFANFDYPSGDDAFASSVTEEATQFLDRTQASPCLAVLCGGSEVYQQAAMLGLPARKYVNPLFETHLPQLVRAIRGDVAYVVNSPSGGALPFVVDVGVGHYWGVGGYRRGLDDTRRARVRFASECLAFANVPPEASASDANDAAVLSVADPRWKAGVPRDIGSPWDFEDVRDHYLEELFGVHAAALRAEDPDRYLMLSRATQADVMRHVFTEWMRAGSPTHGGLILMLQDLQPGAGWGILTSDGRPKSPWYALKRQFRPVSVTMTDEGVNGLDIHLGNEMNREIPATLQLVALRHGHVTVLSAQHAVTLAARSRQTLAAFDIMGRFFDLTYAYRFGPAEHDAVVARLSDAEGRLLGETVHFPLGHRGAIPHAQITAEVRHDDGGWRLELAAQRLARFVHIVDDHFLPDDDWFHLVPGHANTVRLRPRGRDGGAAQVPRGVVRAINLATPVAYKVVS